MMPQERRLGPNQVPEEKTLLPMVAPATASGRNVFAGIQYELIFQSLQIMLAVPATLTIC